jgi:hypothetical protein
VARSPSAVSGSATTSTGILPGAAQAVALACASASTTTALPCSARAQAVHMGQRRLADTALQVSHGDELAHAHSIGLPNDGNIKSMNSQSASRTLPCRLRDGAGREPRRDVKRLSRRYCSARCSATRAANVDQRLIRLPRVRRDCRNRDSAAKSAARRTRRRSPPPADG